MILIIGASGYLGNKLFLHLGMKGLQVTGTYYRNSANLPEDKKIYLDLEKGDFSGISQLGNLTHIILCHGISNIEQCKKESALSNRVNVANTLKLLEYFRNSDTVPVFFSTNMVYSGRTKFPSESERPQPQTEYGRQKLLVEEYIRSAFPKHIIIRPTKIFGVEKKDGTLLTLWMDKLLNGEKIMSAYDSFISPVYIMDVLEAVERLIKKSQYGIFNLGNYEVLSVYNFSLKMVNFFHYEKSCVEKISIRDLHFIEERPRYNSVDCTKIKSFLHKDATAYEDCFKIIQHNYTIN